jgi:gliding motility-associated-like protein
VDTWYRRIVTTTPPTPCGNSISNVIMIDVNASPVAEAGADNTICINDTITIGGSPTGSGGNPPYTYLWWSNPPLEPSLAGQENLPNPVVFPTATTTYYVVVTDQTPCRDTDINIWPNTLRANAGGDQTGCNGVNGGLFTLNGSASGGQSPYTWEWSASPAYLWNPPADRFLQNPQVRPTVTTVFTLKVTDANGCTDTDETVITLDPELYADAGNDTSFCYGVGGRLGGSPTAWGGTPYPLPPDYQFFWTSNPPGFTSNEPNPIVFPAVCTTYYLDVLDAHGCSAKDTVVVCPNPQIFVDAGRDTVICHGNNGGSYTLGGSPSGSGGTAPLSFWWTDNGGYFWLPGQQSSQNPVVSPSVSTTFTLTVTDAANCTASDDVVVDLNGEILANAGQDKTMCNSLNGGRWTLGGRPTGSGGTAPYTYLWSSSPPDPSLTGHETESNPEVTPLVNTTYYVTVTDASGLGCRDIDSVVISVSPEIIANAGNDTTVCFGSFNIRLGGSPTGSGGIAPYTYLWTSTPAYGWTAGQNTQPNPFVSPTITTTFYVSVFDAISCVDVDSMVVNMDPQIIVDAGADTIICTDQPTVTITLGGNPTASGGTPPYTYVWSSSPMIGGIAPIANPVVTIPTTVTSITFTVIVTDAANCSSTDQKVVSFNPLFGADAGNDTTVCGPTDITLGGNPTAIGGTPPFVYEWSTVPPSGWNSNLANPVVNVTATTTFALHITDSHACHAYDTVNVYYDSAVIIDSITFTLETSCGDSTATATVWTHGGTPPLSYLWSTVPPQTTQTATGLTAGIYYVTVTSSIPNGCPPAVGSVLIPSPFEPSGTLVFEPGDILCSGDSVKITCLTGAGNTFEWRVDGITIIPPPSPINNITLYDVDHNTEIICIVDSSDCKLTLRDTVWVNTLGIDAGRDTTLPCPPCKPLQIGTPGVPGYSYLWTLVPNGYISDPNIPMPWVQPEVTTTYYLTVNDSTSGCSATDSVIITVIQLPPIFVGNDTLVCKGQCVTIGPNSVPAGCVFNWTSIPPGFNSNLRNPRVCPYTTTMYIFTMIDTVSCCKSKGRVTISVYPTIINAGNDTIICAGDTITIGGPPQPHYSYSWTSNPAGFTSNISNPTVHPEFPTWYILHVNDSIFNCDVVDTVFVDIDIPPVFAGNDTSVCIGDSAKIGSYWPDHLLYTYSWRSEPPGMNPLNFANDSIFMELPLDTVTLYILTMTSNLTGCTSIDTMIVRYKQTPAITISSDKAGDIIFGGQIITFTALPDNYDEYRFYIVPPGEELQEPPAQSGPSNIFKTDRITENQTRVICIALNYGCDSSPDTIIVTLKSIPNAFTPNGDGINDVFLEGMDLTIINRWGQTMYLGTGGWDGKYHGQKCSPGTYYYLLRIKDLNNVTTVLKGAVTIIDIKQ